MKKVASLFLLLCACIIVSSCSKDSSIDLSNNKIKIGSVIFSLNGVESGEMQAENEYFLTLEPDDAWLVISVVDAPNIDKATGEKFAEIQHSLQLEKYPNRNIADNMVSLNFGNIPLITDTFGLRENPDEFTYNVLASFYYDGYSYTLRYITKSIGSKGTEEFVVLLENSAFLTFGEIFTSGHNETTAPTESESQPNSIYDHFFATDSQKKALLAVEQYLSFMSFSRVGLILQLEFDGFTNTDAIYAVDHTMIDWQEQAMLKAKSYLELHAFSGDGLYEQLLYEGFTEDQAKYGVRYSGANFKEQAVRCAKEYRQNIGLSGNDLYEQLIFEGFTKEQAEYGVKHSK